MDFGAIRRTGINPFLAVGNINEGTPVQGAAREGVPAPGAAREGVPAPGAPAPEVSANQAKNEHKESSAGKSLRSLAKRINKVLDWHKAPDCTRAKALENIANDMDSLTERFPDIAQILEDLAAELRVAASGIPGRASMAIDKVKYVSKSLAELAQEADIAATRARGAKAEGAEKSSSPTNDEMEKGKRPPGEPASAADAQKQAKKYNDILEKSKYAAWAAKEEALKAQETLRQAEVKVVKLKQRAEQTKQTIIQELENAKQEESAAQEAVENMRAKWEQAKNDVAAKKEIVTKAEESGVAAHAKLESAMKAHMDAANELQERVRVAGGKDVVASDFVAAGKVYNDAVLALAYAEIELKQAQSDMKAAVEEQLSYNYPTLDKEKEAEEKKTARERIESRKAQVEAQAQKDIEAAQLEVRQKGELLKTLLDKAEKSVEDRNEISANEARARKIAETLEEAEKTPPKPSAKQEAAESKVEKTKKQMEECQSILAEKTQIAEEKGKIVEKLRQDLELAREDTKIKADEMLRAGVDLPDKYKTAEKAYKEARIKERVLASQCGQAEVESARANGKKANAEYDVMHKKTDLAAALNELEQAKITDAQAKKETVPATKTPEVKQEPKADGNARRLEGAAKGREAMQEEGLAKGRETRRKNKEAALKKQGRIKGTQAKLSNAEKDVTTGVKTQPAQPQASAARASAPQVSTPQVSTPPAAKVRTVKSEAAQAKRKIRKIRKQKTKVEKFSEVVSGKKTASAPPKATGKKVKAKGTQMEVVMPAGRKIEVPRGAKDIKIEAIKDGKIRIRYRLPRV